jgi:hypothetical protein
MSHWCLVWLGAVQLKLSTCGAVKGLGQYVQKSDEKIEDQQRKK